MNNIILGNIDKIETDEAISINNNEITILKDTKLYLELNKEMDIVINIMDNVNANIVNINNINGKIKYTYNIGGNLNISKFNNSTDLEEKSIINLNKEKSSINYIFKTISKTNENYKTYVYHNKSNTSSNIINNGVNIINGNLVFDVSSYIPKNIKGCYANQNNRIVNLTDNKCIINPNLYIDCEDVVANHSAYLGRFSDEEMFYITSRGIDHDTALSLLIKGFLVSNIEDDTLKDMIINTLEEI